ncbi:DUF99 family protein [archaeon]|nr:MAG: DUF99 family protein [archaeon]
MLKKEIRILGFDDGPHDRNTDKTVPVVGVIYRGGNFIDGILRTDITVDGIDATEKISTLINSTRHKQQLKIVMFDGITLGGFNIVDMVQLHARTDLPMIAVNRKKPNIDNVKSALKKFPDFEARWRMVEHAGEIKSFLSEHGRIFYQAIGIDDEQAREAIEISTTHSAIPEPLRVAHLIATGIVKGESGGRA